MAGYLSILLRNVYYYIMMLW